MKLVIISYKKEYRICNQWNELEQEAESDLAICTVDSKEAAVSYIASRVHEDRSAEWCHLLFNRWADLTSINKYNGHAQGIGRYGFGVTQEHRMSPGYIGMPAFDKEGDYSGETRELTEEIHELVTELLMQMKIKQIAQEKADAEAKKKAAEEALILEKKTKLEKLKKETEALEKELKDIA